ncbi:MAG TPA: tRNA (adenosine(37)-N6)-threonylcarbamoyltransferase complex ATPase subunit type 1 TsaE [Candidatus Binatia bacterium]|jgi:tRNA threonylcarbamoyladenosine biosynthesis protein TsaE
MGAWSVVSHSQSQTKNCGKKLAQLLEGGEIIGLRGELGSGKTCFVRGVAEELGVGKDAWIRSPTFTLINEYHGRLPVYHIDLYRISGHSEQAALDLREYLYGDGVCLVEWFEYLPADEAEEFLEVNIAHAGANRRWLTFSAHGDRYERILRGLRRKSSAIQRILRSEP